MAVETSAGNTEEDINFKVKGGRGGCMPNLRGASPVGRDGGEFVRGTDGQQGRVE